MSKFGKWWGALSLSMQLLLGTVAALSLWLLWATLVIRLAYWAWVGDWLPWHALATTDEIAKLGQIGDLFGGVNALFAAFAFVGVAIAAFYQHKMYMGTRSAFVTAVGAPSVEHQSAKHRQMNRLRTVALRGCERGMDSRLQSFEAERDIDHHTV